MPVPSSNQLLDWGTISWLVANGYLAWWGGNTDPSPIVSGSPPPSNLIQDWAAVSFFVANGVGGGTANLCPDYADVVSWAATGGGVAVPVAGVVTSGVSAGGTQWVDLSWTPGVSADTGWRVFDGAVQLTESLPAGTAQYHVSNVTEGVVHNYKVQALRSNGTTTIGSAQATFAPFLTKIWGPQTISVLSFTSNSVTLTWEDVGTVRTHWRVFRRVSPSGSWEYTDYPYTLGGGVEVPATRVCTVLGLQSYTMYEFYVVALQEDAEGTVINESWPSETVAQRTAVGSTQAPAMLDASDPEQDKIVLLQWVKGLGIDATWTTEIQRHDTMLTQWQTVHTVAGDVESWLDDRAAVPDTYTYRVRHYKELLITDFSNEAEIEVHLIPDHQHTDTPHGDTPHVDTPEVDEPYADYSDVDHGDVPHEDVEYGDSGTHGDVPYQDGCTSYTDQGVWPHGDVPAGCESHDDYGEIYQPDHLDHCDMPIEHTDTGVHYDHCDVPIDIPYVDSGPHTDTPHEDVDHVDVPEEDHWDSIGGPYTDIEHGDSPHLDVPHGDIPHLDQ